MIVVSTHFDVHPTYSLTMCSFLSCFIFEECSFVSQAVNYLFLPLQEAHNFHSPRFLNTIHYFQNSYYYICYCLPVQGCWLSTSKFNTKLKMGLFLWLDTSIVNMVACKTNQPSSWCMVGPSVHVRLALVPDSNCFKRNAAHPMLLELSRWYSISK